MLSLSLITSHSSDKSGQTSYFVSFYVIFKLGVSQNKNIQSVQEKMFIFLLRSGLSSVSSVPRLPLIAVAYLEGTLAVYDLSTQVLRHSFRHEVRRS